MSRTSNEATDAYPRPVSRRDFLRLSRSVLVTGAIITQGFPVGYEALAPPSVYASLQQSPGTFELGDAIFGRLDTAGSELYLPAADSDTALKVGSHLGSRPWIATVERPQDFPFNVLLGGGETNGGEVVRVTAISGTGPEQTFSVVRGIEGTQQDWLVGTAVQLSNSETGL